MSYNLTYRGWGGIIPKINLRLTSFRFPSSLNQGETMPKITGKQILAALMKDPEYSAQPASVLAVTDPFMLGIPEALKDHLDNVVTLATLMDAKIAFLRYLVDNEYVKKVVAAMPKDSFGLMDAKEVAEMMLDAMGQVIEIFAEVVKDVPTFLEALEITEEQMMVQALNPNTLKLYKTGTLTIAVVLKMQPMVIVKNSK